SQRVEIQLPSSASKSSSGSFRLVGVRLNANGLSGAQTVSASLNNTVNNYLIASPSTGTVINSLNPGIRNFSIGLAPANSTTGGVTATPAAGAATVLTNRNVARPQGAAILVDGCVGCCSAILHRGGDSDRSSVNSGFGYGQRNHVSSFQHAIRHGEHRHRAGWYYFNRRTNRNEWLSNVYGCGGRTNHGDQHRACQHDVAHAICGRDRSV